MKQFLTTPGVINQRFLWMLLVACVALLLGFGLNRLLEPQSSLPEDLQGTLFPQGREMEPFELTDQDGNPFDNSRLSGHWTFMFFGFTNCPDVCPTTMKVLQSVYNKIPDMQGAAPAQVVFVSVDPNRDPPSLLKPYVSFYHPKFIGVTAPLDKLIPFTSSLAVLFAYNSQGKNDGSYTVDHSAQILLFDPAGEWRAVFSPPHKAESITDSFVRIRNWYQG